MKKICFFLIVALTGLAHVAVSQKVAIQYANDSHQAVYAAQMLEKTLRLQGYSLKAAQADYVVSLAVKTGKLGSEA